MLRRTPMCFEDLNPAEKQVLEAFPLGNFVDLPTCADDRIVRAEFIAQLLIGAFHFERSLVPALNLVGAHVTGRLELRGAKLIAPVLLRECLVDSCMDLTEARTMGLRLPGCHIRGLVAKGIEIQGGLDLTDRFTSLGEIDLLDAHVAGSVNLRSALLHNPGEIALQASRARIDGSMLCGELHAQGEIRLVGTRIAGLLSLRNADLRNPEGICLQAERMDVGESVLCRGRRFYTEGEIQLRFSRIRGGLDFAMAQLGANGNRSIRADGVTVDRSLICNDGFRAAGGVSLRGAVIGDSINFKDGMLGGDSDTLLDLTGSQASELRTLFAAAPSCIMSLERARIDVLVEDPLTWPERVKINGFRYTSLRPVREISVQERLDFLRRDVDGYSPQPYHQLAASTLR